MRCAPFLLLMATVVLGACRDKDFCTRAVYEAPISGLQLRVLGHGSIPSGLDVLDEPQGRAVIRPLSEGARTIEFSFRGGRVYAGLQGQTAEVFDWRSRDRGKRLRGLLETSGYRGKPSEFELEELVRAMEGAMSGPKGILLEGQTRRIKVVEVNYAYEACDPAASRIQ